MATELELKLAVGDLHLLDCILCSPDVRSRMHGDFTYLQTESTYFDTPDGKLAARHWALRLRKLAGKSVVTIKTPGEGLARGEWETEAEYLEDAVPKLVKDGAPAELADILKTGALAPVCGTKFTRIRAMLHLDGCVCELAGDIGELSRGARRAPLCELELELKDGEAAPMLAYGRALAEKFGLREEHSSKSERARRLEQV